MSVYTQEMPQSRSTAFPGASKEEEMGKYSDKTNV